MRNRRWGLGSLCFAALLAGCAGATADVDDAAELDHAAQAATGGVPQASITLAGAAAGACGCRETAWDIAKVASSDTIHDGEPAAWSVTVTKLSVSDDMIFIGGYVAVTNTGSAPATIGNIAVNLQRPAPKNKWNIPWVSAAVDTANAFAGDAAKTAKVVASASSEDPSVNALYGGGSFTLANQAGLFAESAASGALAFTDASNNTEFSLTPSATIAPGQTVNLLYEASFDNSVMKLPPGSPIRAELLVTFGNAGGRGGSGASAANIDIDGNGAIGADEGNVRTVASRMTLTLPSIQDGSRTVLLADDSSHVTSSGTASFSSEAFSTEIGGGSGSELVDGAGLALGGSIVRGVSISSASSGTDGGWLDNVANLGADGSSFSVVGTSGTYAFPCCAGTHASSDATITVLAADQPSPSPFKAGDYCSAHTGQWSATTGGYGNVLPSDFAMTYPSGLTIGSAYWIKFTTASAIALFGSGGPPGQLTADLTDPTTSSAQHFGAGILTLQLNVDFSDHGGPTGTLAYQNGPHTPTGLGDLYIVSSGTPADGLTIRQFLAAANTVLGGADPSTIGFSSVKAVSALVDTLNSSFEHCNVSGGAKILSTTPPPT